MVIDRSGKKGNPKMKKTEEELKEELIEDLRKEPLTVLSLACVYVKKFQETGIDVTEKWATTEQQSEMIQKFYYEGYEKGLIDGVGKGRELERQDIAQNIRNKNMEYAGKMINMHSKHRSPTKKKRR